MFFALPVPPPSSSTLSVFIAAHPDDWQLFMGDVAVRERLSGGRVLYVIVSAGGADRPPAYWQAREAGALASMQAANALAGIAASPVVCEELHIDPQRGVVQAARGNSTNAVRRCRVGSATTVFLRLPDGRADGSGFATTHLQSLRKLERHEISDLASVDSVSHYRSLRDVTLTVQAVVREMATLGWHVQFHAHDPDDQHNPGDHADHHEVGLIARELSHVLQVPATYYAGYVNARRADNLSAIDAAHKAYLFVMYDRARLEVDGTWSAYCENPWAHAGYLARTYGRTSLQLVRP